MKRALNLRAGLAAMCGVFLLAAALSAPARSAEPRRNVLFIAIDDLRSDLGALGIAHAKTPELDVIAATERVLSRL